MSFLVSDLSTFITVISLAFIVPFLATISSWIGKRRVRIPRFALWLGFSFCFAVMGGLSAYVVLADMQSF